VLYRVATCRNCEATVLVPEDGTRTALNILFAFDRENLCCSGTQTLLGWMGMEGHGLER
jgi:hypothetical protein